MVAELATEAKTAATLHAARDLAKRVDDELLNRYESALGIGGEERVGALRDMVLLLVEAVEGGERRINDLLWCGCDAVDMYDQANTAGAVVTLGSRGLLLDRAITDLRTVLNVGKRRTILTEEQARVDKP